MKKKKSSLTEFNFFSWFSPPKNCKNLVPNIAPCPQVSVFVWKCNFLSLFSKKFASTRTIFASVSPVHTYTINRFKNVNFGRLRTFDAYVFAIMNPRNNKLAPSLNFFGVGLYCCDVFQSRRNSLKCQNQGKNKVILKGDPTFRLFELNQLEELTKPNLLENKKLGWK